MLVFSTNTLQTFLFEILFISSVFQMKIVGKVEDKEKHELDVNYLLYTKNKLYSAADDGKIKVGQNNY